MYYGAIGICFGGGKEMELLLGEIRDAALERLNVEAMRQQDSRSKVGHLAMVGQDDHGFGRYIYKIFRVFVVQFRRISEFRIPNDKTRFWSGFRIGIPDSEKWLILPDFSFFRIRMIKNGMRNAFYLEKEHQNLQLF
jgi:hypothetical protein